MGSSEGLQCIYNYRCFLEQDTGAILWTAVLIGVGYLFCMFIALRLLYLECTTSTKRLFDRCDDFTVTMISSALANIIRGLIVVLKKVDYKGTSLIIFEAVCEAFYVTIALYIIRFSRNMTTHIIREKTFAIKWLGRIRRYNAGIVLLIFFRMIARLVAPESAAADASLRIALSAIFTFIFALAFVMVRDTRKTISKMVATRKEGDDILNRIHMVNNYIVGIFLLFVLWALSWIIRTGLNLPGDPRDTDGKQTSIKDRDPIGWNLSNLPSEIFELGTFFCITYAIAFIKDQKRGGHRHTPKHDVAKPTLHKKSKARSVKKMSDMIVHENKLRKATQKPIVNTQRSSIAEPESLAHLSSSLDMKKEEFLKTIQLFNQLPSRHFEHIVQSIQTQDFAMGQVIVHQGDSKNNCMYIVKTGSVWCRIKETRTTSARKLSTSARKISVSERSRKSSVGDIADAAGAVVAKLGAGDVFGEQSIMKKQPRAATCISMSPGTTCFVLSGDDFSTVLSSGVDTGGHDGIKRRKSIAMNATAVCWSYRGDSLALATYASNLQHLYKTTRESRAAQQRQSIADTVATPSFAFNPDDTDLQFSPVSKRAPEVDIDEVLLAAVEEEGEGEDEVQQFRSNGLYTCSWEEMSGNLSTDRTVRPMDRQTKSSTITKWVEDSVTVRGGLDSVGNKRMAEISGKYQLEFLGLIGPELTARDILQRLMLYLKKAVECDDVTISLPYYKDGTLMATEFSTSDPTTAVERHFIGIKRTVAVSERFVYEGTALSHPDFDPKDPTMHSSGTQAVIALPGFSDGCFRADHLFCNLWDGVSQVAEHEKQNSKDYSDLTVTESPRYVVQLTRASGAFAPVEVVIVEALVLSAATSLKYDELMACTPNEEITESHRSVREAFQVKLNYLVNCEDLFQHVHGAGTPGRWCCSGNSEFIVRMNVWPYTGSGCTADSPSLLGAGNKTLFQTPRLTVEAKMLTDGDGGSFSALEIDCWINALRNIADIPLSSFVTFEIVSNYEFDALAWCGCFLYDYEKRFISGQMELPLTLGALPGKIFPSMLSSPTQQDLDDPELAKQKMLVVQFEEKEAITVYTEPWSSCLSHTKHQHLRAGADAEESPEARMPTKFEKIVSIDTLLAECCLNPDLSEKSAQLIRRHVGELKMIPRALPLIVKAVDPTAKNAIRTMHKTIRRWGPISIDTALVLLTSNDPVVRAFAVERLDDMLDNRNMCMYMLQLTQALKLEVCHDSALARFLLRRSIQRPTVVGHSLYWGLQAEMHRAEATERYGLLISIFLRHCGDYRNGIGHQCFFMQKLNSAQKEIKAIPSKKAQKKRIGGVLEELGTVLPDAFKLPLRGNVVIASIIPEKCRVMSSKMKPIWLTCRTRVPKDQTYKVLFKAGDDLRQDQLTLQLLSIMDTLWKEENLDLMMSPYGCVATGDEVGLIEIVPNANTVAAVLACMGDESRERPKEVKLIDAAMGTTMETKFSVRRWLYLKENPGMEDPALSSNNQIITSVMDDIEQRALLEEMYPLSEGAQNRFMRSCAGYCVATYVLGIGDRHPSNLMVTSDGRFLHIDFGHFLGNFKTKFGYKRETAPFVFVPQFAAVFGGEYTEGNPNPKYVEFEEICCKAFNILRSKFTLISSLFALMISSGLPELRGFNDLKWLHDKMCPEKSDLEASTIMKKCIEESLNNERTQMNIFAHLQKHYS